MWKRPQLNEGPHVEQAAAGHVRLNPAVVWQDRRHGVRRAVGLVHAPRRRRVRLHSRPLSELGFRMPRAAAVPCWERMDLANSSGPSGRSRACTARRSEPPTRSVGSRQRGAALVVGTRRPARRRSSTRWWRLCAKAVHESAGETLPEVRGGRDESPIGGSGNSAPSKLRWPTLCGAAGSTPALSAQQRAAQNGSLHVT